MQDKKNNYNGSNWKKYFSGWNFLINGVLALIPGGFSMTILLEAGIGVIAILPFFGFIYLIGLLREKIIEILRDELGFNGKYSNSINNIVAVLLIPFIFYVAINLLVIFFSY